ncbi:serine hydrolase [Paenibacillus camelliae]|nr:serine hydrolase [Paenibacillus camelliae]
MTEHIFIIIIIDNNNKGCGEIVKQRFVKTAMAVLLSGLIVTSAVPVTVMADSPAASSVSNHTFVSVQLNESELKKFAEQFFSKAKLEEWNVPGAIISIVQGNNVLYQQGFGEADVATKTAVLADKTLFRTGSIAKLVTATALMQLVEQGKISLDAGVNDYLPEPWIQYSEENPVTIAHLLTHTTGFNNGMDIRPGDIYYTLDDYYDLESYVKASIPKTVRKPGEVFMYDNFASMLQGYIVEYVSQQKFEDYVQEQIFKPLSMEHSGFRLTPEIAEGMATGYMPDGQPYPQYSIKPSDHPHGGWYTTAADAAIFMMAHLNEGSYQGVRILKPETAKLMQEYQVYIQPGKPVMAYGFEASMYPQYDNGQRVIAKGGDILGFSSYMWLLPEHEIGVFVNVNGNNGMIREELYREFMQTFIPNIGEQHQQLNTSQEELAKFEGTYTDLRLDNWRSKIKVTGDGKLSMEDTMLGNIEFTQVDPMTFIDDEERELVFKNNAAGEPHYFKYRNVGYSIRIEEKIYADVANDHVYAPYIYDLQSFNIFEDVQELFRPDDVITRGEYVAYFIRLLKLPLSESEAMFVDTKGHKLEKEIQTALELGLLKGMPGGSFAPDEPLKRQEAAAIVYRLMQLQGAGVAPQAKLKDTPSPWAADAVNMMLLAGFYGPEVSVDEDGDWNYRPQDTMLRKEAAAMLAKLVQVPQQ